MSNNDMTINGIQDITYDEAVQFALKHEVIKKHDIFYIDFKNRFGYSALVFKNKRHIYYANMYQLHHEYKAREFGLDNLHQFYIDVLTKKLYTDEELRSPISSYNEFCRKRDYIINYYLMAYDHASMYSTTAEEAEKQNLKYRSRISCTYLADKNIADTQYELYKHIKAEIAKLANNPGIFREMVRTELANHEAGVTCDYEPALSALNLKYENLPKTKQHIVDSELRRIIKRSY